MTKVPPDQPARDAIRNDLDTTMLVEAAGSPTAVERVFDEAKGARLGLAAKPHGRAGGAGLQVPAWPPAPAATAGSSWANPWDVSAPSLVKPAAQAETYLDDLIIAYGLHWIAVAAVIVVR